VRSGRALIPVLAVILVAGVGVLAWLALRDDPAPAGPGGPEDDGAVVPGREVPESPGAEAREVTVTGRVVLRGSGDPVPEVRVATEDGQTVTG